MKERLSDTELDRAAGFIVRDFSPDATELDAIADSVKLRRDVRLAVAELTAKPSRKGWIFGFGWMYPVFGAILLGVCFGAVALTMMLRGDDSQIVSVPAAGPANQKETVTAANPSEPAEAAPSVNDSNETANPELRQPRNATASVSRKNRISAPRKSSRREASSPSREAGSNEERLTDFIALSYAEESESGQIVRVKVPSAMMVTLGVVSEVRNSTELVSADVVVGDDGLARAIRFVK